MHVWPNIFIAAASFVAGAAVSWFFFWWSAKDDKKRHKEVLQEFETQKRTIRALAKKLEEQSQHTVTTSVLSGNVLSNDDRPVTDEQRRKWIEEVSGRGDAFATEWVSLTSDLKKFDLRWWNPYGLDAVNIEISFRDYERIKLANKQYEAQLLDNGKALGVFYAPDMGTPSPFPVIVTYSIAGDRREERFVWEGEYEG